MTTLDITQNTSELKQEVTIRLFGAYRNLQANENIKIKLSPQMTMLDIKQELKAFFSQKESFDQSLVDESMLANNQEVLSNDSQLGQCKELAILPPVCGG